MIGQTNKQTIRDYNFLYIDMLIAHAGIPTRSDAHKVFYFNASFFVRIYLSKKENGLEL